MSKEIKTWLETTRLFFIPVNIKLYSRVLNNPEKAEDLALFARPILLPEVAMNVNEELLYDFSINMPRLLVSGQTGIIDNVKKIVFITANNIVVDHGTRFSAINGNGLRVKMLEEERMIVTGDILSVEFYPGKKGEPHGI